MRYSIRFANDTVGQTHIPPFDVEVADGAASTRTLDLTWMIRNVVADRLVASPAPGADGARGVIREQTQVVCQIGAGEGAAYYGTTTLGRFSITAHP